MYVTSLGDLVQSSGLRGIVRSTHELDLLQKCDLCLVTVGIRFSMQDSGYQKRIMEPERH